MPVATTTTLTVSPLEAEVLGAPVTLTAVVSPSTASGTVQFKDGDDNLGAPVAVAGGTAEITTSALPAGGRALRAVFVPASLAAFTGSQSGGVSYLIAVPIPTAILLVVTPSGSAAVGSEVTLTATVTPAAAGNVQFKDGSTSLGSKPVVNGTATISTNDLAAGSHTLTAVFTPPSKLTHTRATSPQVTYVIVAPAIVTTTSLSATPASPRAVGTAVTFKATVSGTGAAGTVQFKNGNADMGAAIVLASGSASLIISDLPAGTHSITAVFVPTIAAAFTGSTSAALSYTLTAPVVTTATTLAASPVSPQAPGVAVAFTAGVSGADAVGSVQFKDGASNLGSPVSLTAGSAAITTSALTVGTHSITAVFTPTNAAAFTGSTSGVLAYTIAAVVQPPVPVNSAKPVVIGSMRVGTPANCLQDKWSGASTFTRQWLRDGKVIAQAAGVQYRLTVADLSRALSCSVTATNAGGSATATSAARTVEPGKFVSVTLPIVLGKIKAGQKLKAVPGSWGDAGGAVVRYQWMSGKTRIRGGTTGLYLVKVADVGGDIRVSVTISRPGFTPVTLSSAVVLIVMPRVVGLGAVGQTLSVSAGWLPPGTVSSFQWYRNGVAIARANRVAYKTTGADKGAKLTVRILVRKGSKTVATLTPPAVSVVKR